MFHTCEVKIAKIAAHSGPSMLFLKITIKPTTVIERKLKTGTDCKISIIGMINRSAALFFAAHAPKVKVKIREKNSAIKRRMTVRRAYDGRCEGSRDIGMISPSW